MPYAVSCQYAHHDHSESVDLGSLESNDVMREFDRFNWSKQVEEAGRLQKCAPTFAVEDKPGNRLIWVSAYGDPQAPTFVSECRFPQTRKALFGLLTYDAVTNLHTNDFSLEAARRALENFVAGANDDLQALYAGA